MSDYVIICMTTVGNLLSLAPQHNALEIHLCASRYQLSVLVAGWCSIYGQTTVCAFAFTAWVDFSCCCF